MHLSSVVIGNESNKGVHLIFHCTKYWSLPSEKFSEFGSKSCIVTGSHFICRKGSHCINCLKKLEKLNDLLAHGDTLECRVKKIILLEEVQVLRQTDENNKLGCCDFSHCKHLTTGQKCCLLSIPVLFVVGALFAVMKVRGII